MTSFYVSSDFLHVLLISFVLDEHSLASYTLVEHFLVRCEEFRWERQDLLEKIRQMKEQSRLEWCMGDEGKTALLLGRSVRSLEKEVGDVDECIIEEVRK